jgi:hypothetical protein
VRARFLALAKIYHPNRFARRPRDVVRLANEIFLLLRNAYQEVGDSLDRDATPPPTPAELAERHRRDISPASQPKLGVEAALARRRRARSYPMIPAVSSSAPPVDAPAPAAPVRPVSVSHPPARQVAPSRPPAARPPRPSVSSRPPVQPAVAPAPARAVRPADPLPPTTAAGVVDRARLREERQEERYRAAVGDVKAGRLAAAREALRSLMAENPNERKYRAYYHYAGGREHDLAGRTVEAAGEYDRALAVDPTFEPARQSRARIDLDVAREPGRLGRWFRR